METQEMCELRRASDRKRKAGKRASENDDEVSVQRLMDRKRKAACRANETEHHAEQRRASNTQCQANKRANESASDTEQRRASNRQWQASKRANESTCDTEQRRASSRLHQANKRAMPKAIESVIEDFLAKVKVGPDFVCTSCHRMLYKHAVVGFKPSKYTNISPQLLESLSEHAYINSEGQQWVCKTCDGALSRGNLPVQAKANGMQLDSEPAELSCLNALEQRLISLRVPFMKMVALPSGKQRCIHGPAVNVPSKIDRVCTMLPRLHSECELVPLKLKRKLSYKGHYLYDYVSPQKLINALKWLKSKQPIVDLHY